MKRRIVWLAGIAALVAAVSVGPLGTAAAAPYLYGCTPGQDGNGGSSTMGLQMYNSQTGTATVTVRFLTQSGIDITTTLGQTNAQSIITGTTKTLVYSTPTPASGQSWFIANANITIATIRVVSDKALSVGIIGNTLVHSCPMIVP